MKHTNIDTLIGINVEKFLNGEYHDFDQLKIGIAKDLDDSADNGLKNKFDKNVDKNFKIVLNKVRAEISKAQAGPPISNTGIKNDTKVGDGGIDLSVNRASLKGDEKESKSGKQGGTSRQEEALAAKYSKIITAICIKDLLLGEKAKLTMADGPKGDAGLAFALYKCIEYNPEPYKDSAADLKKRTLAAEYATKTNGDISIAEAQDIITKSLEHAALPHLNNIARLIKDKNVKLSDAEQQDINDITTSSPTLKFNKNQLSSSTSEILKDFINESGFSGEVFISQGDSTHQANSENVHGGESHCIASISKIMTGVLFIKMLQKEILTKKQVNEEDIELPATAMEQLKLLPGIQERLGEVSLQQLMTHKSGITDFVPKLSKAIQEALDLDDGTSPPTLENLEDFLPYCEEEVEPIYKREEGETEDKRLGNTYSNASFLIAGLAMQHAYNKDKTPDNKLNFDEIMREYVTGPAEMNVFSKKRPEENSCANPVDLVDRHQYGSPAGGYWTNAESLHNFGKWLCKEWEDPKFQKLVKEHGAEFCWEENGKWKIGHTGGMQSLSSNFNIDLKDKTILATLSNRPAGAAFHFNKGMRTQLDNVNKVNSTYESKENKSKTTSDAAPLKSERKEGATEKVSTNKDESKENSTQPSDNWLKNLVKAAKTPKSSKPWTETIDQEREENKGKDSTGRS